jgi:hypothetical protein
VTKETNRDLVEWCAAITGKIPILDIRGLSPKKTAVGPCYAPPLRGLEGVYPVFTPVDLTGEPDGSGFLPECVPFLENCVEFTKL